MFVYFQKTTPRPWGFLQQKGVVRSAPTTKTKGETAQRWKTLTMPGHASSQKLCVATGCPGPNQRWLDLHCHHLSIIQISLLACTYKELFDIETGSQNCWTLKLGLKHFCYYMFISNLQLQDFSKKRNGGK